MNAITTRFAPSPTGDMHLGNLRTAYFNYLAARSTGGKFILRIDDTDVDRNNASSVDGILRVMDWADLKYDLMVKQSDRLDLYYDTAQDLINRGIAYRDDGAIKMNGNIGDTFDDVVCGTCHISDKRSLHGIVLIRSTNNLPTYHFANVVDDITLGVNMVIRGSDHIANTPRHISIARALDATYPRTGHVGLIHYKKRKLSKRDPVGSVSNLIDSGVDPRAVLNYINRLGWAPTDDNGRDAWILPRDRALDLFWKGGSMKAKSSNFDDAQFDWICRRWKNMG